jgi:sugar lactone lactonase YvrE
MSARWAKRFALGGFALLIAAPAFAEGRLPAFFRLRREAAAAVRAGDAALARTRMSEALALAPTHPGVLLGAARLTAPQDPVGAVALVDRYARLGLFFDIAADKTLAPLAARPDFTAVAERLAANRKPGGQLSPVATLPGAPLAEGVAYDPKRKRLLVSQVHGRKIVAVAADGTVSDFTPASDDLWSVFGIAADPKGRTLWALSSATDQTKDITPEAKGATALLRIDLDTGRILARHATPADGTKRQLGDLTLAADGTVYASNSLGGEIWRLKPGAKDLDLLVRSEEIGSAQGLATSPDGKALLVADYPSGLHRIDLATAEVTPVTLPADLSLIGADGVLRDGRALIVVQNGVTPQRVLRLSVSPDGHRVERAEVLAANLPDLDEPTGGVMRGRDFVFVARSQWSDFGPTGQPRDGLAPAKVMSLRIAP